MAADSESGAVGSGAIPAGATNSAGDSSDLFISYSHSDRPFAFGLRDALVGLGRSVWIDEQSIPGASRWADDLRRAIEGTGCFVFVISPDSVASVECMNELSYATSLNKRII